MIVSLTFSTCANLRHSVCQRSMGVGTTGPRGPWPPQCWGRRARHPNNGQIFQPHFDISLRRRDPAFGTRVWPPQSLNVQHLPTPFAMPLSLYSKKSKMNYVLLVKWFYFSCLLSTKRTSSLFM